MENETNLNVLKKGSALSRYVMFSVFISLKVVSQRKRKKTVSRDRHRRLKHRDTLWKLLCRVRKLQITNSRIRVTGYYHCVVTSSSWSIYSTATRSSIICYSLQSSDTEFLRCKRYPRNLSRFLRVFTGFLTLLKSLFAACVVLLWFH